MDNFIIFLKGFLSIIIGLAGVITCIAAFVSHSPFFIVCGGITAIVWVYFFIKFMKEHFSNGRKE